MTSATKAWRVYGADGHRQRESFGKSETWDFSNESDGVRIIDIQRADKTGTNDYVKVVITRNTFAECDDELKGQISDGLFENDRVGDVIEVGV